MPAPRPARRPSDFDEALTGLAAALWTEREALELVLFKLVQQRNLLSAGSSRWLARADEELRDALVQLHSAELFRAIEVDSVAGLLDLSAGATLAELGAQAPEPWPPLFAEHRARLRSLLCEVDEVSAENRRLLDDGAAMLAALLQATPTVEEHRP